MKPKFIHLFSRSSWVLLSGLFLLAGCKVEDPVPLTSNSAIRGYTEDQWNQGIGAEVTAIGPYGNKKVLAGEKGYFFIGNLGNGTYDLEYAKEGYGSYKKFGIQLFGGDTVYAGKVELYERYDDLLIPPLLEITDHRELAGLSEEAIVIRTHWTKDLPPVRFFIGYNEKVDLNNYEFTQVGGQLSRKGEDGRLYMLYYFYQLPLESGQKVYLVAYVCNGNDNGYLDLHSGKLLFPTLVEDTKSNVLMFEIP